MTQSITPRVFVSAASSDLASARKVVNDALTQLECLPIEESVFGTDYGPIHDLLQRKIASCQAVIHLVGRDYGGEPDPEMIPNAQPRRSWTQIEYDLALDLDKKLYVIVCDVAFPLDEPAEPEDDANTALQTKHRQAVLAGKHLWHTVHDAEDLRQRILLLKLPLDEVRSELKRQQLRHRLRTGLAVAAIALILCGVIFGLSRLGKQVDESTSDVKDVVQTSAEKLKDKVDKSRQQTVRELTNPDALAASIRTQIEATAKAKIEAVPKDEPGRWQKIAEIERRRDVQLTRVDDLIRLIQDGLKEGASEVFQRAVEILNDPPQGGIDRAIAYLESRRPSTLDVARRHAERAKRKEEKAKVEREQRNRALRALVLEAELRQNKLNWPAALELREQVAELAPDWFEARLTLGSLLDKLARYREAESHKRAALALAATPEQEAIALHNLAVLLRATNRLAEAEPMLRRALAIDEQSYGAEHPRVATDLNNLAQLLQATNRLAEAELLMRRALAIDEQSYGAEHPNVARDLNNLALLLQATNRLVEAEPLMRRALAIDEQSYGAEHPNVARDLNNLALLLQATNRRAEAEPLSRRMVEILVHSGKATGHEHPNLHAGLQNYRLLLAKMKLGEDETDQRTTAAMATEGPLKPIVPEVERLLGPAKPVAEVLTALDQQYKDEGKPAIYYLPLAQPIAPHLDELLGSSDLSVAADEPIAPHLDKLLGPARTVREVVDELDRQYREEGKPAVWFLPLDQPIAPHLGELLGPARSVDEVLKKLDQQYRRQGKPAVWFLPLDEPISPHLDELLGPAPPVNEVLKRQDQWHSEQPKPAVWFLPLDEPISRT